MNFEIGKKLYYAQSHQADLLSMQNACVEFGWSLEDGVDDGGYYYIICENPQQEEFLTTEEIKKILIDQVQQHLDNACRLRGYDNGFACASYVTSSVPKFKAEAEAYVLWRDKVWSYCYAQLDLFEQGKRDIPIDLIGELPKEGD